MYLQHLYLRSFRSYHEAEVSFSPGVNLIRGGNAQGKTNLLEAIYFLSTGRSFRTPHLSELIQEQKNAFFLEAHFIKDSIPQVIKVSFDGQTKKMEYNSTSHSSFTPLLGLLPTVLYAPEDASLVTGAPTERRRFIDFHLAQMDPLYVHHLTRYHRAMKQRNHLLRQQSEVAIEPWEHSMAQSASYIVQKREEAMSSFATPLNLCMQLLSRQEDSLELRYLGSLPSHRRQSSTEFYKEQFLKNRKREMYLGATLTGPHREDLSFLINQKEAKAFSSEGQKRCAIAALRLAEWQSLHQMVGSPPLMSIDDFGVHLDQNRQLIFQEQMNNLGQVFLTSPNLKEELSPIEKKQILLIEKGKVLKE